MTARANALLRMLRTTRKLSSDSAQRPHPLASELAAAYIQGTQLGPGVAERHTPASLEAAYDLQREMVMTVLQALSGEAICGFKAGATNATVQASMGLDGPFFAPILARNILLSPAEITPTYRVRGVEAEFAFRLGKPLPPRDRDYSEAEVLAAVESICPAIEVCASRLRLPPDLPSVSATLISIADQGSHGCLVLAEQHRLSVQHWGAMTLRGFTHFPVKVLIDNVPVAHGDPSAVLGNPLHSLTWLCNSVSRLYGDVVLEEGVTITTGTMTGLSPLPAAAAPRAAHHVVAQFEGAGKVKVVINQSV